MFWGFSELQFSKRSRPLALSVNSYSMAGADDGKPGWCLREKRCQTGPRFALWEHLRIRVIELRGLAEVFKQKHTTE